MGYNVYRGKVTSPDRRRKTMKLAELIAYAEKKYHIQEKDRSDDMPGTSVLSFSHSGSWAALLIRQRDPETGAVIERCDLKCGEGTLNGVRALYLSPPFRMRGPKWIGVTFNETTDRQVVFKLFDRAVASGDPWGYTIVLDPKPASGPSPYRDTPLPFPERPSFEPESAVPERIRQMRAMDNYGSGSFQERCRIFREQAVFMQDYEDDAPWFGSFNRFFPTYHDLTVRQLRGYFAWRTRARKGEFTPLPPAAACIYIYELLNGIGADSPEDSFRKLREFESGYPDSGFGTQGLHSSLRRWMFEFAVIHGLPVETARQYADEELLQKDEALAALRYPESHSDGEIFSALCFFEGNKLAETPVTAADKDRGTRLFAETWRTAAARTRQEDRDIFTSCIGSLTESPWHPLASAVILQEKSSGNTEYVLDDCRTYLCRNGAWTVRTYEGVYFNRNLFQGFCHMTDLKLRKYLKTGRYLRERPEEEWAAVYADEVIEADKQAILEASRPKITIDFSGLERIRKDAAVTRDSLLTGEETIGSEEAVIFPAAPEAEEAPAVLPDIPLNELQVRILRTLLRGGSADALLRDSHQMASVFADGINEALFDMFGDTVLACEDDRLSIVEDYREELSRLFEGNDQ